MAIAEVSFVERKFFIWVILKGQNELRLAGEITGLRDLGMGRTTASSPPVTSLQPFCFPISQTLLEISCIGFGFLTEH